MRSEAGGCDAARPPCWRRCIRKGPLGRSVANTAQLVAYQRSLRRVPRLSPDECTSYFAHAGYISILAESALGGRIRVPELSPVLARRQQNPAARRRARGAGVGSKFLTSACKLRPRGRGRLLPLNHFDGLGIASVLVWQAPDDFVGGDPASICFRFRKSAPPRKGICCGQPHVHPAHLFADCEMHPTPPKSLACSGLGDSPKLRRDKKEQLFQYIVVF